MPLRSSLYLADTFPTVTDEEGEARPVLGFVQIGTDEDGKVVLHAEPGTPALPGMTTVKDGSVEAWTFATIPQLTKLRIMEAEWTIPGPGPRNEPGPIRVRGKVAALPGSATVSKTGLTPHLWYGEVE